MSTIDLAKYGLTDRYETLMRQYPEYSVGRIVSQEKGFYRVITSCGEQIAEISGKYRYQINTPSEYPAVGDFVMLNSIENSNRAVIHQILPRKSVFMRKNAGTNFTEQVVAANIDTLFICMSLNNDFNLRRLERFLSIGWNSGAVPVIVLTKADLCNDVKSKQYEVELTANGADVLITSSMRKDGYQKILPYLKEGVTTAMLGSSGVGKSTLINLLLGKNHQETQEIRGDDKGRHTTTRRELILLPSGGMIIDTPGIRELGMWDSASGLEKTFTDIEAIINDCRYKDCTHTCEPGCAVLSAIQNGNLSAERWKSYQKLQSENAFMEDAKDYFTQKEKKYKEIAKLNKSLRK